MASGVRFSTGMKPVFHNMCAEIQGSVFTCSMYTHHVVILCSSIPDLGPTHMQGGSKEEGIELALTEPLGSGLVATTIVMALVILVTPRMLVGAGDG